MIGTFRISIVKLIYFISAIYVAALCLPTVALSAEDQRPNILFIMADDVGSEVLECYGGQSYLTPRIDQLAREGLRFEHAYALPACHPTRTTLLSSRYPFRLGHPEWGTYPPEEESHTIAHVLANAGYDTAVAGKWQIAFLQDDPTHPQRLGFQESCLFGWHEGPRYYQPHIWQNGQLRDDVRDRYGPDVYSEFLIDFMKRKRDRPFFAYYPMALCHDVTDDLDKPVPLGPKGRYQNYAEMVAAMDERVGRLMDALHDNGLRENTLVVFFTDNGTPAKIITGTRGDKLVREPVSSLRNGKEIPGGKAQLTDAGTRVPLIVRWPRVVAAGRVSHYLIDTSDFYPTLAELAAAPLASDRRIDGRSFANVLRGASNNGREWVFVEFKGKSYVKDARWKLYDDGRLLDLSSDPQEHQPLDVKHLQPESQRAYDRLQMAFKSVLDN